MAPQGMLLIKVHYKADGDFPNGIPNPLLIENRQDTAKVVREHNAGKGLLGMAISIDVFYLMKQVNSSKGIISSAYWLKLFCKKVNSNEKRQKLIYGPWLRWNAEQIIKKIMMKPLCLK